MAFEQQKIKRIYGTVLILLSVVFLIQAISGLELISIFQVFKWLGLTRNPIVMIISMLALGGMGIFFIDRMKQGRIIRNEENQKKANSYSRSLIISILTLWSALLVIFIVGAIKLTQRIEVNQLFSYLDFSNNPFFLNIYLYLVLFYSGLIGNLTRFRAVTDSKEETALLNNLNKWWLGKKNFSQMISEQKNIEKNFESKDEE